MKNEEHKELRIELREKLDKIKAILEGKKVILAYSGGIDSTLLLFLSHKYSKKTKAIFFHTPLISTIEVQNARHFSEELGIPYEKLFYNILMVPEVERNGRDRCYYCKKTLFSKLLKLKESEGYDLVIDGTNKSDLEGYSPEGKKNSVNGEKSTDEKISINTVDVSIDKKEDKTISFRPGLRALKELDITSPLALARLTKKEIYELVTYFNLPTKDITPQACLATRIPYGLELRNSLLIGIDRAEKYLIKEVFKTQHIPLRVRLHLLDKDDHFLARIETSYEGTMKLIEKKEEVITKLKKIGFTYITLDLEGYVSGSMERLLTQ